MLFSFKKGIIIGTLLSAFMLTSAFAADKGVVTGTNVNVRTSNNMDASVYVKLNTGDTVDILELSGDYYRIMLSGSDSLYISKDFVSINEVKGQITADAVNIRKYPSLNNEVLAQADMGESYTVTGQSGEWYNIVYEGESAFVHKSYLSGSLIESVKTVSVSEPVEMYEDTGIVTLTNVPIQEQYVVVNSPDGLKLRELPSTSANVVTVYSNGTAVDMIEDYGDWVKVSLNGTVGYMSKEYVSINEGVRPPNMLAQEIIAYARQFLGTPYSWGGTSLTNGVDCSGFVYSVMRNFGITLNRSSRDQIYNGYQISKSQLETGDLVFFDTNGTNTGRISHVGIYMGNGQFIHSSSSKRTWGVTISSLSEDYYTRTYVSACRILN